MDLTTLNGIGYSNPAQADLRPGSSGDFNQLLSSATTVAVDGLTLEAPSLGTGGGYNSTLSDQDVTLLTPLSPGGSLNINVLFKIFRTGSYKYYITIEALIGSPS